MSSLTGKLYLYQLRHFIQTRLFQFNSNDEVKANKAQLRWNWVFSVSDFDNYIMWVKVKLTRSSTTSNQEFHAIHTSVWDSLAN